jgi:hypothetical protein
MPVAIPWIGLALTAVGTGVAVAGQQQQAKAQEKAAEYNAAVAENNATAQRQAAEFEASKLKKRQMILLGKQRAAFAKSGIEGGYGDVLYDSALEGELDRMAIIYSGQVGANNQYASAVLSRAEGRNARTSAMYNSAGTILTGAGRMAGQYNTMNNPQFGSYGGNETRYSED